MRVLVPPTLVGARRTPVGEVHPAQGAEFATADAGRHRRPDIAPQCGSFHAPARMLAPSPLPAACTRPVTSGEDSQPPKVRFLAERAGPIAGRTPPADAPGAAGGHGAYTTEGAQSFPGPAPMTNRTADRRGSAPASPALPTCLRSPGFEPLARSSLTCGDAVPRRLFEALIGALGSGGGVGEAGAHGLGRDGCADRGVRRGRRRIVAHVGSAHTEAELGLLLERARGMLTDVGQDELDVGVEAMVLTGVVGPTAAAISGPQPDGS